MTAEAGLDFETLLPSVSAQGEIACWKHIVDFGAADDQTLDPAHRGQHGGLAGAAYNLLSMLSHLLRRCIHPVVRTNSECVTGLRAASTRRRPHANYSLSAR